eukprot:Skav228246  [mRNA]  locus=scaffold3112:188628:188843:- [translate_table: standard]
MCAAYNFKGGARKCLGSGFVENMEWASLSTSSFDRFGALAGSPAFGLLCLGMSDKPKPRCLQRLGRLAIED